MKNLLLQGELSGEFPITQVIQIRQTLHFIAERGLWVFLDTLVSANADTLTLIITTPVNEPEKIDQSDSFLPTKS